MESGEERRQGGWTGRPVLVRTTYNDEDGLSWVVLVPKGAEDAPERGIVVGPPDLSPLGLPDDVRWRLHQQLFQRGLIEAKDLRGRTRDLVAALQAAYKVDVARLSEMYQ